MKTTKIIGQFSINELEISITLLNILKNSGFCWIEELIHYDYSLIHQVAKKRSEELRKAILNWLKINRAAKRIDF